VKILSDADGKYKYCNKELNEDIQEARKAVASQKNN